MPTPLVKAIKATMRSELKEYGLGRGWEAQQMRKMFEGGAAAVILALHDQKMLTAEDVAALGFVINEKSDATLPG